MAELSIAFLTIPDIGPKEAIIQCSQLGIHKLGIRLIPAVPGESEYPLLTQPQLQSEVCSLLADHPISIADVELIRISPQTIPESFLPLFEVSAKLQAQFVTVINDDPVLSRAADTFSSLVNLAQPYGLTLNLEPMPWTAITNIPDALKMVQAPGLDNTGILLDVFHFSRCGMSLKHIELIPEKFLRFVQVCDAPLKFEPDPMDIRQEAQTSRFMPGDGELPIQDILKKLPNDIILSVEVPNQKLLSSFSSRERIALAKNKALKLLNFI